MKTCLTRSTLLVLTITSSVISSAWSFPTSGNYLAARSLSSRTSRYVSYKHPQLIFPKSVGIRPTSLQVGELKASYVSIGENSFFLTRIVFLRALAFVYGVAFLVAKHQSKALIGDNGIAPAREILDGAEKRGKATREQRDKWLNSTASERPAVSDEDTTLWQKLKNNPKVRKWTIALIRKPIFHLWLERLWDRQDGNGRLITTLLWLADDRRNLNPWLEGIANWGLAMSVAVFVMGAANVPLLLGLWACQRSLMAVGGPFWGYGWESQLAELGFHALFLVPLLSLDPLNPSCPPSKLVLFTIRWHLFRIMMGAGLIKIRSSDMKWKWPNLSTMYYFYETQPVPNPISRYLHWMPRWWHKGEVLVNHFVELVAPWLLLVPIPSWRRQAGLIQIIFQVVLISSGNLSFLNWLTIVPTIACFDDAFLGTLFPSFWKRMAANAAVYSGENGIRGLVSFVFMTWIAYLSIPVVKNLMSKRQVMNGSFGPLRLVNTYGAFGDVDEVRYEFVVSGATSLEGPWKEFEFKAKPGNVMRKPRFISPYHFRLDWQFWIASTIGKLEYSPWIYSFLMKLLERDPEVLGLLESDPFQNGTTGSLKYIRVDRYRYEFYRSDKFANDKELYWRREPAGRVFPRQGVATVESLKDIIAR